LCLARGASRTRCFVLLFPVVQGEEVSPRGSVRAGAGLRQDRGGTFSPGDAHGWRHKGRGGGWVGDHGQGYAGNGRRLTECVRSLVLLLHRDAGRVSEIRRMDLARSSPCASCLPLGYTRSGRPRQVRARCMRDTLLDESLFSFRLSSSSRRFLLARARSGIRRGKEEP
jgi:hypothetical protein